MWSLARPKVDGEFVIKMFSFGETLILLER